MLLLREHLDKVEEIKCPRKDCHGKLKRGLLTQECPACGQLFLLPLLFDNIEDKDKRDKNA